MSNICNSTKEWNSKISKVYKGRDPNYDQSNLMTCHLILLYSKCKSEKQNDIYAILIVQKQFVKC